MAIPRVMLIFRSGVNPALRTVREFNSLNQSLDWICYAYERYLQRQNENVQQVTYDIDDLYDFLDNLASIICMVWEDSVNRYIPRAKPWIKDEIRAMLIRQYSTK